MTAFAPHHTNPGLPGFRAPEGVEGGTGDGIQAPSLPDIENFDRERAPTIEEIFEQHSVIKYDSLRAFRALANSSNGNGISVINTDLDLVDVYRSLPSGNGVYQVHVKFPDHENRWLVGAFGEMLPDEKLADVAAGETVAAVRDERLGQLIALIKELKEAGVTCNVKIYGLPQYNNDWDAGLDPAPEPLPDWWADRNSRWADANRNAVCAMFKEAGIDIVAKWGRKGNE